MSSGGGSSAPPANTTTTSTVKLPDYAQPAAESLLARSTELSNAPFNPYPGQRLAPVTGEQEMGLNMTTNRALAGSPVMNAASQNAVQTLNGDFLRPESNPYLKSTVDDAMGQVQSRVNSQFNRPGAFGGSAHQELLTRSLGQVANDAYGQNYAAERAAQQRMSALAPQFAQQDYTDAQALLGVGDVRRQANQDVLNMQYEDFMNQQNQPYKNLDVLANALRASVGGGGQTITSAPNPYQPNRFANAIGGGLAGAGIGSMYGNGQYAPVGAAAGGLLGLWG